MERLINKTLFIDDDLDTNLTLDDGFLKRISEEKTQSANRKFKSSQSFKNRAAFLLVGNNYPRLIDVSEGMTRRFNCLVFPRSFYSPRQIEAMPEGARKEFAQHDLADPRLIDRIRNELPGVVNILVDAYQRLIKRGGFSLPEAVKEANERVLLEGNPLPLFLKTKCRHATDARYKTSVLAYDLRYWAAQQGLHWKPSNQRIRNNMRHRGWGDDMVVTVDGHEHYVGIGPNTGVFSEQQKGRNKDFEDIGEDEQAEECPEWLM